MRRTAGIGLCAATSVTLIVGSAAHAAPGERAVASTSCSRGACSDGTLENGVRLSDEGAGYVVWGQRRERDAFYGTAELVDALTFAAAEVARRHPGAVAVIGELSARAGGPLSHHSSHQAGRDVDVLFYLLGPDGRPLPAKMVPIEPDGSGIDFLDITRADDDVHVKLDRARTWSFIEALIKRQGSELQRIMLAEHVRTLLLREARRVRAARAVVRRFEEVTCQPGYPHDDHMHLRFFCAADDLTAGCRDEPPIYPWRMALLRKLGTKPQLYERPATPRTKAAVVTFEQSDAELLALPNVQPEVRAFLERQKAWRKPPKTGRRWCR